MTITPKKITELLETFPGAAFHGNKNRLISCARALNEVTTGSDEDYNNALVWVSEKHAAAVNWRDLPSIGLLVVPEGIKTIGIAETTALLYVKQPRQAFTQLLNQLISMKRPAQRAATAQVAPTARIGSNCFIGHNVVIEDHVIIGDDVQILHNTVILQNTTIGNRVTIGSNCTIGNYGFGYEKNTEGRWEVMPHSGGVFIDDEVEIHNNTCIDCGVMGNTYIGKNVKIDNQVHVAHGVTIEANSLIIANTVLGGNVVVGANSWIAPTSTIKNQLRLAPDTFTGMGAVLVKDTVSGSVMVGNPAEDMERYKKWSAVRKGLLGE
jgi:UDP-3-O-[3-hydroxymyristoyl] glucosamine N-acyltransferase